MKFSWAYLKKFFNRIVITETENEADHCWSWVGRVNQDGYGRASLPGGKKSISSHRLAWLVEHGEIPEGKQVLHSCDNPGCVNPRHLYLGTQKENMEDMVSKGRSGSCKGSLNGNSKLTEQQVGEIKRMIAEGAKRRIVADKFKISTSTVDRIIYGWQWKHVSGEVEEK